VNFSLASLLDFVPLVGALAALFAVMSAQRKATLRNAVSEGSHLSNIVELRRDLTIVSERVACVERDSRVTEGNVIGLKADMKHVLDSLIRIEAKLDKGLT
jgi:hypothetical protein